MYNKLFTKILDSTIWLEADATRLVWITFLAMMDEDGFVPLSSVGNVANRARVSVDAASSAIQALEAPDKQDPSQEQEGRRIEKVPGGWMVLNAARYREMVRRVEVREATRERVRKFRAGNADVTGRNVSVTQSEAVAVSESKTEKQKQGRAVALPDWLPVDAWNAWLEVRPKVKAPNTPRALQLALQELDRLRASGNDPKAVLERSTMRGWRGLFPLNKETPDYSEVT